MFSQFLGATNPGVFHFQDVAELLRRLAAPAERRPAAAGHASTVETVEAETTEPWW